MSRVLLSIVVLSAACVALAPAEARAQTRRLAVVVGNNAGSGARPALRYAEADAAKVAHVLTELGDVAPADLTLLLAQGVEPLRKALAAAGAEVARWQRGEGARAILVFYFSGHSDGTALELGRERLAYKELRQWLEATGAAVRVAVVDSCSSGALLAAKGGVRGPSFDIRLTDNLDSTGHALLTSSAANEMALESGELGGSFFTHHLVSGLRGAADASGDGRVTLGEAYQYAFIHTLSSTADTFVGGQHPAYDFELSGQGDFVLTHLSRHRALITLPPGVERALVTEQRSGVVMAELGAGARSSLAVPPGVYTVRAWRGGSTHRAEVEVAAGQERTLRWAELPLVPARDGVSKGATAPRPGLWSVASLGLGVHRATLRGLPALPRVHLGLRGPGASGPTLGVALGWSERVGETETAAEVSGGWRWGQAWGALSASVGGELEVEAVHQRLAGGLTAWSVHPAAGPWVGGALQVSPTLALEARAGLSVALVSVDDVLRVQPRPGGWLGLAWSLP